MPQEAQLAVLFADVSGSTQLYDTLGDVRARTIVARCIAVMTEVTHRHGGTLVKTIGDEVMTTFPDPVEAAEAACEMQEAITGEMVVEGRPLAIRVGFHFGPTLLEEADVFGDAVNLAARMASQAKSGQILTTGGTVEHLTGARRKSCRQIDLAQVKGKREEIAIYRGASGRPRKRRWCGRPGRRCTAPAAGWWSPPGARGWNWARAIRR